MKRLQFHIVVFFLAKIHVGLAISTVQSTLYENLELDLRTHALLNWHFCSLRKVKKLLHLFEMNVTQS